MVSPKAMATFRHILAATDFSEASARALELARSLAAECGAELTIVYVCEVPGYAEDAPIPSLLAEAAHKQKQRIRSIRRAQAPIIRVTGTWNDYLNTRLADRRREMARKRRKLERAGTVTHRVVSTVDEWPEALLDVSAIERNSWKEVAETSFTAITTGRTNLMAAVVCRNSRDLYRYLAERISALDDVHTVETAPLIRTVKRAGAVLQY